MYLNSRMFRYFYWKRDKNTVKSFHFLQCMQHLTPRIYEFKTFCIYSRPFKGLNLCKGALNHLKTHRTLGFWLCSHNLQCTTMGPAPVMLSCFILTSSRKSSTPPGSPGTPWSGQARKWYCHTVRSVLPYNIRQIPSVRKRLLCSVVM